MFLSSTAGFWSEIHGMCLILATVMGGKLWVLGSLLDFGQIQYQSVHILSGIEKLADQAHNWSWNLKICFCTLKFFLSELFYMCTIETKTCFSLLLKLRNSEMQKDPSKLQDPRSIFQFSLGTGSCFSLYSCAHSPFISPIPHLCVHVPTSKKA